MTPFSIEQVAFDKSTVNVWGRTSPRHTNWPVVYVLDGDRSRSSPSVYVGETVNAAGRLHQHLSDPRKAHSSLKSARIVIDERFNKSACLDLEAHLIRWLAGDGQFTVLNSNDGIRDADYFDRSLYRESFAEIFEELRSEGLFDRSIPQIENSDLFKLSPFKSLTHDQAIASEDILEGLFTDLRSGTPSTSVIQGGPGTGKTIIGIFLMKLLADIRDYRDDDVEHDSVFFELFVPENRLLLQDFAMALVVPQQSLRDSIRRVFRRTPNLSPAMVLSPFEIGKSKDRFDLLIVDETHRLNQRANQASGVLNRDFRRINERLFGHDDLQKTQLDWIEAQSDHRLLLLDGDQSVRPADLPEEAVDSLLHQANADRRRYPLTSQMRVKAGADYVDFIRRLLSGDVGTGERIDLGEYDLRFFDDVGSMVQEIRQRDEEAGLARLVAGYAWDWASKKDPTAFDIVLDDVALRWNSTDKDWINSPKSLDEVGSIHTVQGYDLNYAGVIIGPEFGYDTHAGRFFIDRAAYRDTKGKENNPTLGRRYDDDDLLRYIRNIYGVLLTRGMLGTYVYVCDSGLRGYMRKHLVRFFSASGNINVDSGPDRTDHQSSHPQLFDGSFLE